jgi:hypothetical protein
MWRWATISSWRSAVGRRVGTDRGRPVDVKSMQYLLEVGRSDGSQIIEVAHDVLDGRVPAERAAVRPIIGLGEDPVNSAGPPSEASFNARLAAFGDRPAEILRVTDTAKGRHRDPAESGELFPLQTKLEAAPIDVPGEALAAGLISAHERTLAQYPKECPLNLS